MWHRSEAPAESATSLQRDLFCWSLLASAALLIALAAPLLAGRISTRDDLGAFHLPARAFYSQQLKRGEPFDWMPGLYSGFYLTGEGQAGTYHPLHLLLDRLLPLPVAVGCQWLAAYPLMLAGTWLFLRRRLRRADAAMLGSILFTFSGFNLLHFVHPNAVAVVAHIPWLLWAIDIVLVDFHRQKVALAQAAIALLTGSQLLLGYPQYVWFSLLVEAAYAAFLAATQQRAAREGCETCASCAQCVGCTGSSWGRLVVAKGVGLLLGGVQLLPTIDAFAHSARRSADASFAAWGSLHPLNLVQLVAPYMFTHRVLGENTHELGVYLGAVPLMLAVWTLAHRAKLGRLAPLAGAAAGFGVLALLLALGDYGPIYRLQSLLPFLGQFRFPCRYMVLCHLATAVLASMGFILLTDSPAGSSRPRQTWWKQFEVLWVLVAVSVVTAAAGLLLQGHAWIASRLSVLAGPLLLAAAAVLVALAARGVRFALIGLILLAAADLGCYGLSYAVYPGAFPLEQFVAATDQPPGGVAGRVIAAPLRFDQRGLRTGNQMTLAGWQRADGYAGLEPQQRLDYRQLPVWRAAGVRWVKRSAAGGAAGELIPSGTDWLEVPRPLPRVRLVSQVIPSDDPSQDIQRICVDTAALSEVPLALPPSAPGTAQIVAERAGRLQVRVDCPAPQLLVVAESFHPGWHVAVDDRRQAAWRINGDFLGCPVSAGRHDVVFEFRPRSLTLGRLVSCLGLGLLAVCLGCGLRGWAPPQKVEDFSL